MSPVLAVSESPPYDKITHTCPHSYNVYLSISTCVCTPQSSPQLIIIYLALVISVVVVQWPGSQGGSYSLVTNSACHPSSQGSSPIDLSKFDSSPIHARYTAIVTVTKSRLLTSNCPGKVSNYRTGIRRIVTCPHSSTACHQGWHAPQSVWMTTWWLGDRQSCPLHTLKWTGEVSE